MKCAKFKFVIKTRGTTGIKHENVGLCLYMTLAYF